MMMASSNGNGNDSAVVDQEDKMQNVGIKYNDDLEPHQSASRMGKAEEVPEEEEESGGSERKKRSRRETSEEEGGEQDDEEHRSRRRRKSRRHGDDDEEEEGGGDGVEESEHRHRRRRHRHYRDEDDNDVAEAGVGGNGEQEDVEKSRRRSRSRRRSHSRDRDDEYRRHRRSRRYRDDDSSSRRRYGADDDGGDDRYYRSGSSEDEEERRRRRRRRRSSRRHRRYYYHDDDGGEEGEGENRVKEKGYGSGDGEEDEKASSERRRERKRRERRRKSGWDEMSDVTQMPGMIPPAAGVISPSGMISPPGVVPPGGMMVVPPHASGTPPMYPPGMTPPYPNMAPQAGMMGMPPMMMNPQMLQQQQLMTMMQLQKQQHQRQQTRRHNFNPDTRIYVGNINFELNQDDLHRTFEPFGEITNVVMSFDNATGKHKGFCFIDFKNVEDTNKALQTMNGFELGGRNLKVSRPINSGGGGDVTAPMQPNFAQSAQQGGTAPPGTITTTGPTTTTAADPIKAVQEIASKINENAARPTSRIYVGSIHWEISEDQIRRVFSPFGTIRSCALMPNPETGKHRGYGFIEYSNPQEAQEAIKHMDGFELGSRNLRVGPALGGAGAGFSAQQQQQQQQQMGHFSQNQPSNSLSQEENMTISSNQRFAIMQKLAKSQQKPTRCILLTNMIGPDEVDEELEEELMAECNKFGNVEKLTIYQEKQSERDSDVIVKIFVLFQMQSASDAAFKVMDGRFFGGRQIQAEYFDEAKYLRGEYSN